MANEKNSYKTSKIVRISIKYLVKYCLVILLSTIGGGIIGSIMGAISYRNAGYSVLFGADQGWLFGAFTGFAWGVMFGWVNLIDFHNTIYMLMITVGLSLPPAIFGLPPLTWIAGMFGSFISVPIILLEFYGRSRK